MHGVRSEFRAARKGFSKGGDGLVGVEEKSNMVYSAGGVLFEMKRI
jgi:hypothetical protein